METTTTSLWKCLWKGQHFKRRQTKTGVDFLKLEVECIFASVFDTILNMLRQRSWISLDPLNLESGVNFIQKSYPNLMVKVIHTNKSCKKFLSRSFIQKGYFLKNTTIPCKEYLHYPVNTTYNILDNIFYMTYLWIFWIIFFTWLICG